MINEAVCLFAEGAAGASEIDQAMKLGANHPIGPLALADLIGIDVILAIMENLHSEIGEDKYRPHPLLKKMMRAGMLGEKTNSGFYKY
jgi:3-hydroxybutyryl-CoA dehydrogenase